MKQTEQEKTAAKEAFRQLSFRQKAEHIWIYYKWAIILAVIALVIAGSALHRHLTRKDRVLYLALTNVTVGADLTEHLTDGYLRQAGLDPKKAEVLLYQGLYLAEGAEGAAHQSAYASQLKVMAATEAKQLDAVLMSKQSYDILSGLGYLVPIEELCAQDTDLLQAVADQIVSNDVILEDNDIEYRLGEAEEYKVVTETVSNAVAVQSLPCFSEAIEEPVYLGFLANSPRLEACRSYLRYLLDPAQ